MAKVDIYARYRAKHAESIEQRHLEVIQNMAQIGPPLGFLGMQLPAVPECGAELCASYYGEYDSVPGLRFFGSYVYRGEKYIYQDQARFDDSFRVTFETSNSALNYRSILHQELPKLVQAFRAYQAKVTFGDYAARYSGGTKYGNPTYNALRAKKIDIDGRNNVFTLRPAQYWDTLLCERALGYGPDEVVSRLQGLVPRVERYMDGVYIVFNDNNLLTYEEFAAVNDRFKPILELV